MSKWINGLISWRFLATVQIATSILCKVVFDDIEAAVYWAIMSATSAVLSLQENERQ